MKLFDLKAALPDTYGKTHWLTVGTIFASDDGCLMKSSEKKRDGNGNPEIVPVGFVINYPACKGIVVPRPKKPTSPTDEQNVNSDGQEPPI